MRTAMTVLAVSFILASCAREPVEEVHTVEWFLEPDNIETLISIRDLCKSNPGEYKDKPNCANNAKAIRKISTTRWIDDDGKFVGKTYTLEQVDRIMNGGVSQSMKLKKYIRCLERTGSKNCNVLLNK
ncbi:MAG: EexN family lipoprotein [Zoogloeaceae bacterium]|nr:EexN family lipoprotein [Zoogloeaceae bacterium]